VVLRQALPPYFDLFSLYLKPSSILHRHEYLQANRLFQAGVSVEAGRQTVAEAGQGEEVDQSLLEALEVEEAVQSPGALVEEVAHHCWASGEVEAPRWLASVVEAAQHWLASAEAAGSICPALGEAVEYQMSVEAVVGVVRRLKEVAVWDEMTQVVVGEVPYALLGAAEEPLRF
jgi:hypothetical protein